MGRMMRRILAVILAVTMVVGGLSVPAKVEAASLPTVNEAEMTVRVMDLAEKLGLNKNLSVDNNNGLIFTDNQVNCGDGTSSCTHCKVVNVIKQSWFISKFGSIASSNYLPKQYFVNGNYSTGGNSCYGFANFALWYLAKQDSNSNVVGTLLGTAGQDFNKANLVNTGVRIGDVIRLGQTGKAASWGHSVVFLGYEGDTAIKVLDCNWRYSDSDPNCKVRIHTISYKHKDYNLFSVTRAENYVPDSAGSTPADTTPPVISNIEITDLSSSGYTISCDATDNVGVVRVQFPTWTKLNEQDDIIADWGVNEKASGTKDGNRYTYRVNISDHNNERGEYATHIYAYDAAGNYSFVGANSITVPEPENNTSSEKSPYIEKIKELADLYEGKSASELGLSGAWCVKFLNKLFNDAGLTNYLGGTTSTGELFNYMAKNGHQCYITDKADLNCNFGWPSGDNVKHVVTGEFEPQDGDIVWVRDVYESTGEAVNGNAHSSHVMLAYSVNKSAGTMVIADGNGGTAKTVRAQKTNHIYYWKRGYNGPNSGIRTDIVAYVRPNYPKDAISPENSLPNALTSTSAASAKANILSYAGSLLGWNSTTFTSAGRTDIPAGDWSAWFLRLCGERVGIGGLFSAKTDVSEFCTDMINNYGAQAFYYTDSSWITSADKTVLNGAQPVTKSTFTPEPGDIYILHESGYSGISQVGIIKEVKNGAVIVLVGHNGSALEVQQRDGTSNVFYQLNHSSCPIIGYIRPNYASLDVTYYNLYLNPNGGKFTDGATTTQTASPQLIYKGFNWNDVGTYTATRDGYTFTGWYTAPTGGTLVYGTDNLACYEGTYWDRDNGYVYQGDLTVYAQWQSTHTHATTLVPAKAATCTEQGNIAYYTCTCGKWFEDSAATKEITDHTKVVTAALTHDWGTVGYTWSDDNSKVTATRTCKRDQNHVETETVNTRRTEVPAKCEEKGSITYEASFANAAFKKQSKQVDVAALGHSLFKHDRVEATEEKPGNIAYWECSRCHALFADADGKQKTTLENTIIPAGTKPEVSKDGFVVYFDEDAGTDAVTYNADRDRYEYVYTGTKITPAVIVAQDGVQLAAGTDYTVKYSNNINVDKSGKPAAVTITGKGNFSGSKTVEFYVVAKRLDDGAGKAAADIQIGNVSVAEGAKVAPTISFNGVKLTTKDYTVTSSTGNLKFTAADLNPTITVVGKGNFAGEIKNIPVTVKTKAAIANTAIKVTMGKDISRTYDGKAQTLTVSTGSSSGELTVTAADGTVLTEGSDFVVSYGANVNAGTVKVTISGSGAYTGSVTKTFKILPDKNISTVTAKLADSAANVMYDKNGAKPSIVVTADRNGNTIQLNEGVDYKITYANNKKVGNAATYTVAFLGNYQGRTQIKGSFEIVKADFGSAKVQAADMIYSKAGKYQSVPFVSIGGVQLAKTDYTVTYWYNGVDITGQKLTLRDDETSRVITVKVTGKGNYQADTAEGTYTIVKASTAAMSLAKAKIVAKGSMKAVPAQAYTGSAITPEIDVYVKNGKTWDKVDPSTYTVTYVNNVAKGKATILVSGDGIHTAGSKTATFRINTRSLKGFLFGKWW